MTTASQARVVVRTRIETGNVVDSASVPVPLRWQNEQGEPLPDVPAPFVYTEVLTDPGSLVGFGGGRSANLYRNPACIYSYVFVPRGSGLVEAEHIAEQIAALFRSYRDSDISCFDASVIPGGDGEQLKPPGLDNEVGNYFYAVAEINIYFDQIG